jgi:hypothetical protein
MRPFGLKSRKTRRLVDRKAWFADDQGFALRSCTIVDMSSEGAQIKVDTAARLPRRFRLILSRSTRAELRCDIRWQRGRTVGVKFVA